GGGGQVEREHDGICGKSVDTIMGSVPLRRCREVTVKARSVWAIERAAAARGGVTGRAQKKRPHEAGGGERARPHISV
ncbi:hypothetical protein, partial [Burkholderia sp.]|uniref:hypothetical protein n=1 Tax=Burkholderia sp. TaxID=36773 RepID=UPI00258EBBB9